jgi:hypothetical protein
MEISKAEALKAINADIAALKKDIANCSNKASIQALKDRVRDYEALRAFIHTRDAAKKTTTWSQLAWVDANRLAQKKTFLREYSQNMEEVVLPYLAFTFLRS